MRYSRTNPETYRLALYYAANPWSGQSDRQHSIPLNAKIIGIPTGRHAERLRVDLVQVTSVNTPVAKPKDRASKAYFIAAITRVLAEHSGRTIDTIRWDVVDFTEPE